MKIHPLMAAAAIAFWGWQTGHGIVAIPVAMTIYASFHVPVRWPLTTATLRRIADFCMVLALLLGGYFYVAYGNPRAIILFFQWLPVLLLPVALAHAYGTAERVELSVLFWSLRRRPPAIPATFDPWFPWYGLWIVAASTANVRDEWFYLGVIALVAWPLVRIRPWSYRVGTWGVAFSIAAGLGYGLQIGLNTAQVWLESAVPDWISAAGSRTDPYRASTDIGHIGRLKESDEIVLRVTTAGGTAPPARLHRASYNVYFDAAWIARGADFRRIDGGPKGRWPLQSAPAPAARATIHDYSARPNPVLSLPAGTTIIENLDAINVQQNPLGAVQIAREPGYFSYVAAYAGDGAFESPPTAEDLRLPAKEHDAFVALAATLGLSADAPATTVARVESHFADGYQYSTFRQHPLFTASPMVDFLLRSKSGHCEYFATATTLLLRAGGVPARYATGFAATEKSAWEDAYIVRQRHAHAWVRAYVNGTWIEVDTTPPSWLTIEAEDSGMWTTFQDRWSWLRFRASRAVANRDERQLLGGALMVVLPFAGWLGWRLYRSRRTIKSAAPGPLATSRQTTGADSEFYLVERQLHARGRGRQPHDTAQDWLARLRADAQVDTSSLADIVDLHTRYRFDPIGLTDAERAHLRQAADDWLARHQ